MSSTRKKSHVWLEKEVILLLELYQRFPILWHIHSSDIKKRNIRNIYIRKIQEGLSSSIPTITVEEIKEKLHRLRTQYQRQRKKIKSTSKKGEGLNDMYKSTFLFYEKMTFLDANEMQPTVSTLNEENILKENAQSEILPTDMRDVNTNVPENEIASGSEKLFHDSSSVDDVDITPPQYILLELTSSNISSKKRKICDEIPTFIRNDIDVKIKKLENLTEEREKFSVFAKMIIEELKRLPPRQQVCTKKLMFDALHIGILKTFENDEKDVSEKLTLV